MPRRLSDSRRQVVPKLFVRPTGPKDLPIILGVGFEPSNLDDSFLALAFNVWRTGGSGTYRRGMRSVPLCFFEPGVAYTSASPFAVQRSAFTVRRSPFAVRRSPFAVRRSPFAVRRSPFGVRRLTFSVHRSQGAVRTTRQNVMEYRRGADGVVCQASFCFFGPEQTGTVRLR